MGEKRIFEIFCSPVENLNTLFSTSSRTLVLIVHTGYTLNDQHKSTVDNDLRMQQSTVP